LLSRESWKRPCVRPTDPPNNLGEELTKIVAGYLLKPGFNDREVRIHKISDRAKQLRMRRMKFRTRRFGRACSTSRELTKILRICWSEFCLRDDQREPVGGQEHGKLRTLGTFCAGPQLSSRKAARAQAMDALVYRCRAWHCQAQAQFRPSREAQIRIHDLAATWLRLAEWAERNREPHVTQQQPSPSRNHWNREIIQSR
jgi:hypothetical protein